MRVYDALGQPKSGQEARYACIYVADGATAQSGIGTSPTKVTGFAANGVSNDATPDHTNDQITINTSGTYRVSFAVSFSGTVSTIFTFKLRINAVESTFGVTRTLGTGGDEGSAGFEAILALSATDVVTIYVEANGATKSITPTDMSLVVFEVAPSITSSGATEQNNLEAVCTGIANNEVPVGSAADVATYTGTTGSGNVVRASSPTLTTPTIGSFTNAAHNHEDAAGGATLASAATPSAIHDDVSGEINAITEKASPVNGDWVLIEDSAAANVKKKAQLGNLPGGGGSHALLSATHSDTTTDTVARGDILVANATPEWAAVTIAGAGSYLRSDGTDAGWAALTIVDDDTPQLGDDLDLNTFGLTNAGDTSIDLTGAATRTFDVLNSTPSQVCNLRADGVLQLRNGTAFSLSLSGTPTADRTISFPDATDTVATLTQTETLANKTLTTPTIASFTNAAHNHEDAAGGATLASAATPSAIHDDTAGEIAAVTLKGTPVSGDLLLIEDSAAANAKKRITVGSLPGGGSNALLDGSAHTDTVAQAVTRGSLVYGNATPAWDELTVGGANTYLQSDGTDVSWGALDISHDASPTLGGNLATGGNSITHTAGITIDMVSAVTPALFIENSGAGLASIYLNGEFEFAPQGTLSITLTGTPTGNRTISLPDQDGTLIISNDTLARGDLLYANSVPEWKHLVVGGAGTYLQADGTDVAWGALDISDDTTPTLGGDLAMGGNNITATAGFSIDIVAATDQALTITNSGAGDANLIVDGIVRIQSGTAFRHDLQGTPTGNRVITLPDTDGTVTLIDATQTLTNKTLTTPTIGDFTNATHDHEAAAGGGTLASAATPSAIHDDVASEISAVTLKATPVSGDLLLIEDSAAANVKKRITVGSLPAGSETNSLETVCTGILANEVPVGSGADVATYTATTGTGDVVRTSSPTIVTPTIASFANAGHNHEDAAGGGTLASAATPSAIHDDTAGEINAVTSKGAPTIFDVILIEDQAAGFAKKKATLGTIPTATHELLSAQHDDTTAGTVARGDLVTGQTATPSWTRLAIGGANNYLRSDGTDVSWGPLDISHDATPTLGGNLSLGGFNITQNAGAAAIQINNIAATTLTVENTSDQCNLVVDGTIGLQAGTAFTATLTHAVTASRTFTLPNPTGDTTIVVTDANATFNRSMTFASGSSLIASSATSLAIPSAAGGTTLNSAGEVCVDTTSETFNFWDGTEEKVLEPRRWPAATHLNPAAGTFGLFFTPVAITVLATHSYIAGGTNVVFNIGHASTRTGTQLDVFTSDITLTSTTGQTNNSGFNDNTIPANSWIWYEIVSVSGSVTEFHVTLEYDQDP